MHTSTSAPSKNVNNTTHCTFNSLLTAGALLKSIPSLLAWLAPYQALFARSSLAAASWTPHQHSLACFNPSASLSFRPPVACRATSASNANASASPLPLVPPLYSWRPSSKVSPRHRYRQVSPPPAAPAVTLAPLSVSLHPTVPPGRSAAAVHLPPCHAPARPPHACHSLHCPCCPRGGPSGSAEHPRPSLLMTGASLEVMSSARPPGCARTHVAGVPPGVSCSAFLSSSSSSEDVKRLLCDAVGGFEGRSPPNKASYYSLEEIAHSMAQQGGGLGGRSPPNEALENTSVQFMHNDRDDKGGFGGRSPPMRLSG